MSKKRVAINGFGRIGRLTLRNLLNKSDIEVVAINDLSPNATLAHLFKYDSAHGIYDAEVTSDDESITINGHRMLAMAERDPSKLPWKENNVDLAIDCTGLFTTKDKMQMHIDAGAKKVLLSAPAKSDGVKTIVLGVNDDELQDDHLFVSNASCTTNCLAPLMKIIDKEFGLVQGTMTTTHAYTADQKIQDAAHKDLRRARAAAYNIVPTTTGAAAAVGKVVPSVVGKLFAMAVRVPVITGSLVELTVVVDKDVTVEEVNATFKKYADGPMKGVLEYATAPLVSADITRNQHSSVFDSMLTAKLGKMIKVVSWYDNEAGYSARLADLACKMK